MDALEAMQSTLSLPWHVRGGFRFHHLHQAALLLARGNKNVTRYLLLMSYRIRCPGADRIMYNRVVRNKLQ
jgi:hypothetical protein